MKHDTDQPDETPVAAAFDELRASVTHDVDVDGSLVQLHSRRSGRPAMRWAALGVTSAAAVLVVALFVAGRGDGPSGETVTADGGATAVTDPAETDPAVTDPTEQGGPSATDATVDTTVLGCDEPLIFVYMEPTATPEQIDAARTQLEQLAPGIEWQYMDQAATYEEFRRLFEDQPQFVETIRPGDLPPSFQGRPTGDTVASMDLEQFELIDGTLRVEHTQPPLDALSCDAPG